MTDDSGERATSGWIARWLSSDRFFGSAFPPCQVMIRGFASPVVFGHHADDGVAWTVLYLRTFCTTWRTLGDNTHKIRNRYIIPNTPTNTSPRRFFLLRGTAANNNFIRCLPLRTSGLSRQTSTRNFQSYLWFRNVYSIDVRKNGTARRCLLRRYLGEFYLRQFFEGYRKDISEAIYILLF